MKTISDMLRERDRERRQDAARRDTRNLIALALIAVLMGAATACVLAFLVTAIRLVEFAPAVGGIAP